MRLRLLIRDMGNKKERLVYLLEKYADNTCQKDEFQELFSLIEESEFDSELHSFMQIEWDKGSNEPMASEPNWDKMYEQIVRPKKRYTFKLGPVLSAAAVLLIALSVGIHLFVNKKDQVSSNFALSASANEIAPGGNRAILTLSDGRVVDLNPENDMVIIDAAQLKYSDGTEIATIDEGSAISEFNTIATPKGGQYTIVLPDGSKVWLNAESSLTFPASSFMKKERRLELKGEAYFEVARDEKVPFVVTSKGQEVKVLGTHFNVNAYSDEGVIKTTLLEGSVRVSTGLNSSNATSQLLIPNQQSAVSIGSNSIKVNTIDPLLEIAWKNGLFDFQDKSLEQVMRELARWYDLEIIYEGDVPHMEFFGKIRRNNNLAEVLHILESAELSFKVEDGRKLIITAPKKNK